MVLQSIAVELRITVAVEVTRATTRRSIVICAFMRIRAGCKLKIISVMCLLAWMSAGIAARAQEPEEVDLSAKQRILPAIGPGLRAVRQGADGRLYVLASPSPGLSVVDSAGKQLLTIGESPSPASSATAGQSLTTFGDDCDVDAEGKIYVADRG